MKVLVLEDTIEHQVRIENVFEEIRRIFKYTVE